MTDANISAAALAPVPGPMSERRGKQGRLKVFPGMASGVGKTAARLPAALAAKLAGSSELQYVVAAGTAGLVALMGFLFAPAVGAQAFALLSLPAVAVLALLVGRGPALLAAAVSAAIWNYFFLPPVFEFRISHFEDALLLGMYFMVPLTVGQLRARIRVQEVAGQQRLSELSAKVKMLAESERLGKTLLDSMSHEIRTPVAAIRAAAADLAELKSIGSPGTELIAEIQEAAGRLNSLVGKVLDMTRLESGHIKPLFNECEVNDIVNVAVAETEKELARHTLTVDLPPDLPIIRTDFVFLQQALMNLLSNAALHTPAGTPVNLRVWKDNESIFLAVADRGPGIDAQPIGRVFDKFYRAPDAPTGGTGLGLSLVKGFVEALGGKVKAENRIGGGVEFTIALPLSDVVR